VDIGKVGVASGLGANAADLKIAARGSRSQREVLEPCQRIGVLGRTSKRGLAIASVVRVARREVVIGMAVDVIGIEETEIELAKDVRDVIGVQDEAELKTPDQGEERLLQVTTGVATQEDEAEATGKMIEIGEAGMMGETAREDGALRIRTATTSDRGLPGAYEEHNALRVTSSSYFLTLSGLYIIRRNLAIIVGNGTGAHGIYFKELGGNNAEKPRPTTFYPLCITKHFT
jgi:hypothetical protein